MAQMLIVLGASTTLGATAGGVIGFFFGGAGAAPGAVLGGELGFELGTAILTWMGVAFLAKAIVQGLGEIWARVSAGLTLAWNAPEFPAKDYPRQIEQAAQHLADAVGTLVLVILQAIVAWVFAKAGIGATKAAVSTGESISALGSEAAADEAVGALVHQLRGSRLGPNFADWVEKNWSRLRDDPKLRFQAKPPGKAGPPPVEQAKIAPDQPITDTESSPSFKGKVGGKDVELDNVSTRRIEYQKRPRADYNLLRKEFDNGARQKFVRDLANDPDKAAALQQAGLGPADLERMADGRVPAGWQVHHKIPLDDGGTNAASNLVLIKNVPAHQVITNAQSALVGDLAEGGSRTIDFPVPDGFVYPPSPGMVRTAGGFP